MKKKKDQNLLAFLFVLIPLSCILFPFFYVFWDKSKDLPLRVGLDSVFECKMIEKRGLENSFDLSETKQQVMAHRTRYSGPAGETLKWRYFDQLFNNKSKEFFSNLLFDNPYHNGELYWMGKYDKSATQKALAKRFRMKCEKTVHGLFDFSENRHVENLKY